MLDKSISAHKSNALDGVYLSTHYATLDIHVSRLRRNLLASSKTVKNNRGPGRRSLMGAPPWLEDNGARLTLISTPVS